VPSCRLDEALALIDRGHQASLENRFIDAERYFRAALAVNAGLPMAHNNLAWVLQKQGRNEEAIQCYERALGLNGNLKLAQVNLALLLSTLGRIEHAGIVWRNLLTSNPNDREVLNSVINNALRGGDLAGAFAYSERYAALCRHSAWHCLGEQFRPGNDDGPFPIPVLTIPKLKHDIAQFRYLRELGMPGVDLDDIIRRYELALKLTIHRSDDRRDEFDDVTRQLIGHVYNRIVHLRDTPRVQRAYPRGGTPSKPRTSTLAIHWVLW